MTKTGCEHYFRYAKPTATESTQRDCGACEVVRAKTSIWKQAAGLSIEALKSITISGGTLLPHVEKLP